jgi:hypothetical protein
MNFDQERVNVVLAIASILLHFSCYFVYFKAVHVKWMHWCHVFLCINDSLRMGNCS